MLPRMWYTFAVQHEYNRTRRKAWNSKLQHFIVYVMIF